MSQVAYTYKNSKTSISSPFTYHSTFC